MKTLRTTDKFELNIGTGMANGLFNLSNIEGTKVSNWFGHDFKDELMSFSDAQFDNYCETILN